MAEVMTHREMRETVAAAVGEGLGVVVDRLRAADLEAEEIEHVAAGEACAFELRVRDRRMEAPPKGEQAWHHYLIKVSEYQP